MNKTIKQSFAKRIGFTFMMMVLTTATAWADITGNGSSSDPYVLNTADDWATFATNVNGGTNADKCYKLSDSWDNSASAVTTTVGTSDHPFTGTFDGNGKTLTVSISETATQGTAPFRYISGGAVIKNLTVEGSVTGTTHAAGLVGFSKDGSAESPNTIDGCTVSASVTVNTGSNMHMGGVVGHGLSSYLKIKNTVFSGTMSNGGNYAGGLQGWSDGNHLTLDNCLFKGSYSGSGSFHPIAIHNTGSTTTATVRSAYYTAAPTLTDAGYIAAAGTQVSTAAPSGVVYGSITAADNQAYLATVTVSGVSQYYVTTGSEIKPEPTVTAADGTVLMKDTHYTVAWSGDGKTDGNYTLTVTGTGGYSGSQTVGYTLRSSETLGSYTFSFGSDADGIYYKVDCPAALNGLAAYVNADKANTCVGKRFKQTQDINMQGVSFTPIGKRANSQNYLFSGTYDGGGFKISNLSVNITVNKAGLFGYTKQATITRVTLENASITSSGDYVGGIIGDTNGGEIISFCTVSGCTISGQNDVGGIIGEIFNNGGGAVTVKGCTVTGGSVSGSSQVGGIAGYAYASSSNIHKIVGCVADNHASLIGQIGNNCAQIIRSYASGDYTITAGENVSIAFAAIDGYPDVTQPARIKSGETVAVTLDYTGSNPNHYEAIYHASNATLSTDYTTLSSATGNVVITATLSSTPRTDMSTATVADIADQQYTGGAVIPSGLTVTLGTTKLTEGTDYTVTTDGRTTGTATATINGQGHYYGTVNKTFRIVKSGACGTTATYLLTDADNNGKFETLEIGGTGAMTDYESDENCPWHSDNSYMGSGQAGITSLTIGSGITHIGNSAFSAFKGITHAVAIPEGVQTIGDYAFSACWYIPSVSIPASVTAIGNGAFQAIGASNFTLTTADGSLLSSIGECTFGYINGTIDLSTSRLTTIPEDAFWACDATAILPSSVTTIAENAFHDGDDMPHIYVAVPTGYTLTANGTAQTATDGKADIKSVVNPTSTGSTAVTLAWTVSIAYANADGTLHDAVTATPLDGTETSLAAGTYAVVSDITYDHTLTLTGDVTLILKDGCTMNVGTENTDGGNPGPISGNGIKRNSGEQSLTIYGQSGGTGALSVYTTSGNKGIVAKAVTINGGNVTIDAKGDWSTAIYAGNDDITINGGNVNVTASGGTHGWGLYANHNVIINGGNVNATGTNYGIRTDNNNPITLGWTNPADRIYASSYGGTVKVADGKALTDGTNIYSGTLTASAINGKTLRICLVLDETDGVAPLTALAGNTNVAVCFTRSGLTENSYSTMCLPFGFTKPDNCTFYAFQGIHYDETESVWVADVSATTTLNAHTPYIFKCTGTEATFSGTIATVAASYGDTELNDGAVTATVGDDKAWTFKGTYTALNWSSADPTEPTYGFSTYVPASTIAAGTFVRFVQGASLAPFRAHLIYSGTDSHLNARTRGTASELPQYIIVRIVGSNGDTTAIGTLDTTTGELSSDGWYTLGGRKLSGKPTAKGLYINNSRKVIVK